MAGCDPMLRWSPFSDSVTVGKCWAVIVTGIGLHYTNGGVASIEENNLVGVFDESIHLFQKCGLEKKL